ncbi:MAG: hypothetical protein IPL53_08270 [Ignavibacteria bacterium]|nr:hypothetical protein [Ignavibacteria bacterium]
MTGRHYISTAVRLADSDSFRISIEELMDEIRNVLQRQGEIKFLNPYSFPSYCWENKIPLIFIMIFDSMEMDLTNDH